MNFSRNNMVGTIPKSVGNLSTLQMFDISHNSFHGALPTILNNLMNILSFIINDNHFTSVSGVQVFFLHLDASVIFGGGSCAMDSNPWRCPIPKYVLSFCNATCGPH